MVLHGPKAMVEAVEEEPLTITMAFLVNMMEDLVLLVLMALLLLPLVMVALEEMAEVEEVAQVL